MKKIDAEEFLKQKARYLPRFLKDWHKQKDVFKVIWGFYTRNLEASKGTDQYYRSPLEGMTWISSHVYVIDYFLWFMARYGYTPQRDRRIIPSRSLEEDIRDMKDAEMDSLARLLKGKV